MHVFFVTHSWRRPVLFVHKLIYFFLPMCVLLRGDLSFFFQLFIAFVRLTCFDCFNCVFCRLTLSALTELKLFLRSTFYSFHFFPLFQFSSPSINCRCCCCCCRHARKELEMTFDGISFTLLYPSSAYWRPSTFFYLSLLYATTIFSSSIFPHHHHHPPFNFK